MGRKSTRGEVDMLRVGGRSDLTRLAESLGFETVEAEEWAVRAISPCDERLQNARQFPDNSGTDSAVITSRILHTVVPPAEATMWNCIVYFPPLPDVAFLYQAWDPTTGVVSDAKWTAVPYRDVQHGEATWPVEAGTPPSDNYPAMINRGTLIAQVEQFRQTQKGATINLNASSLTNQGMVLTAQYGDEPVLLPGFEQGDLSDPVVAGFGSAELRGTVIALRDIPVTTDGIFAKDPHATRTPARLGSYLPLKYNNPVSPYRGVTSNEYYSTNGTNRAENNGPAAVVLSFEEFGGQVMVPIYTAAPTSAHTTVLTSVGWTNMNTGIVYFEGLDPKATLDVKVVAGLELVATGDSVWTGFMEPPPQGSDEAQRQVHAIQRRLPSGFPASYNSLGTLLSMVMPYLGKLATDLVGGWINKFANRAQAAITVA